MRKKRVKKSFKGVESFEIDAYFLVDDADACYLGVVAEDDDEMASKVVNDVVVEGQDYENRRVDGDLLKADFIREECEDLFDQKRLNKEHCVLKQNW